MKAHIVAVVVLIAGLFFTAHAFAAGRQATVLAGDGTKGYAGDGGPAISAKLSGPYGLARKPGGDLYFCDCDNSLVRKIDAAGIITTVAGNGHRGYSGDGGNALKAELNEPYEVRFDRAGNLYFVERLNHLVRKVDAATNVITTIAGTGKPGFGGDGGPATAALLNQPHSIQFGPDGSLYICDIVNHRIRRVDMTTGVISTFAGTGEKKPTPDRAPIAGTPLNGPRAIDFDRDGNLWLALREGNAVYKLDLRVNNIHHVAGTGKQGATGNGGPALQATLSGPKGLSIGADGNVYLADTESHSIRMIDVARGTIEQVAGTGTKGDGPVGDALACTMARPHGIFVEADGTILVGDTETNRIRAIGHR